MDVGGLVTDQDSSDAVAVGKSHHRPMLAAFSLSKKRVLWAIGKSGLDVTPDAVVLRQRVYAAYADRVVALGLEKGDLVWEVESGGSTVHGIAAGANLYVASNGIEVLDENNGKVIATIR